MFCRAQILMTSMLAASPTLSASKSGLLAFITLGTPAALVLYVILVKIHRVSRRGLRRKEQTGREANHGLETTSAIALVPHGTAGAADAASPAAPGHTAVPELGAPAPAPTPAPAAPADSAVSGTRRGSAVAKLALPRMSSTEGAEDAGELAGADGEPLPEGWERHTNAGARIARPHLPARGVFIYVAAAADGVPYFFHRASQSSHVKKRAALRAARAAGCGLTVGARQWELPPSARQPVA